ncbi:MAG: hypothetical protein OHK0015_04110 [Chloroflexi bacterium OHK40]
MSRYLLRSHAAVASLLLALALGVGTAFGAGEQLRRATTMSGGGTISVGALQLRSSIGQPAIGAVSSQLVLCGGLQCGPGAPAIAPPLEKRLFLPLAKR